MIQYNIYRKRLQLWTNADNTEYAIYLKSTGNNENNKNSHIDTDHKLLVKMNHNKNTEYTRLLDECDYLDDLEYDWKYTLEQWVDNEKNKDLMIMTEHSLLSDVENSIIQKQMLGTENYKDNQETQKEDYSNNKKMAIHRNLRKYKIRSNKKKRIKCHFCKLEYHTHHDRLQHEQVWHPNKTRT
ncbi:MAG TPA: hypothetical protein VJ729_16830 [Nitrososphaeraceae archaeon]|nr:hypothetical protein [Nitrososphaeraceae archaeon]